MIAGNDFRIFKYGNSKGLRIPKDLANVDYATLAAENLILADPTGEIPSSKLAEWLKEIEMKRISWIIMRDIKKGERSRNE